MKFILYKTTNTITGKYYIGVTNGNNPLYKGSGTALKEAIKKYGASSFVRETLETFSSDEEAFRKEAEIVNADFVKSDDTYNLKVGGKGGVGQLKTERHKENISKAVKEKYVTDKTYLDSRRRAGRKSLSEPDALISVVQQFGIKQAANMLDLTYYQCRDRYFRMLKKLK